MDQQNSEDAERGLNSIWNFVGGCFELHKKGVKKIKVLHIIFLCIMYDSAIEFFIYLLFGKR